MSEPIITISLEGREYRTEVNLDLIKNSLHVGIMLASATRVVAAAVAENCGKPHIEEQFIAFVREAYEHDIKLGDLGESDSLYKRDG